MEPTNRSHPIESHAGARETTPEHTHTHAHTHAHTQYLVTGGKNDLVIVWSLLLSLAHTHTHTHTHTVQQKPPS